MIAPKTVAEGTWAQEARKWDHTQGLRVVVATGSAAQRRRALYGPGDVYVIGRDNIAWAVEEFRNGWPFDMVVIDESTSFKNSQSKRFRALRAVRPHIRRLVELTGTPSPNGIEDLWAQIYLLDGGQRLGKSLTAFREAYLKPGRRGADGTVYEYKPRTGAEEAVADKIRDLCLSMQAADYLDLPEIIQDDRTVALSDRAREAYEQMEADLVLQLAETEIDAMSAAALTSKLLQIANGAVYDAEGRTHRIHDDKLRALAELVESLQEGGQSALVFYEFRSDRERILEMINGATLLEGPAQIEAWNRGEIPVLLAHPASAAYGLNLQAGGHHIIWYGLTWNFEQYTQANARLHRQGQTERVIVHQLICEGTRDEDVAQALERKGDAQAYIMDSLKARIRAIQAKKTVGGINTRPDTENAATARVAPQGGEK